MIRFTTREGAVFRRRTYEGVVGAMKNANWSRDEQKGTYMEDVIDRVQQISGVPFKGKLTPYRFLRYLDHLKFGALTSVDDLDLGW